MNRRNPENRTYPRRGSFTLELILVMPIVLLGIFLTYQVSVMLGTYQSLRAVVYHASCVAAQNPTRVDAAIELASQGYYYHVALPTACTTNSAWNTGTGYAVKYRLLVGVQNGDSYTWSYASPTIAQGTPIAVEIKLENLSANFPQYWILSRFVGVDALNDTIVMSQVTARQ